MVGAHGGGGAQGGVEDRVAGGGRQAVEHGGGGGRVQLGGRQGVDHDGAEGNPEAPAGGSRQLGGLAHGELLGQRDDHQRRAPRVRQELAHGARVARQRALGHG